MNGALVLKPIVSAVAPRSLSGAERTTGRLGLKYVRRALAFGTLVVTDFALRVCGFRGLRALSAVSRSVGSLRSQAGIERSLSVSGIVDIAATYYYKHTWCLHRATATSCFLHLHGVDSQVCIGYSRMPFHAHAWVEVGGVVVKDNPKVQSLYRVIDRF